MANRISLTHLTFVGPGKAPATVDFGPRTTVIHGPSDTGKSFIVDAIDFMLRGSTLREIPQRAGYSTVLLGIRTPTGEDVTLTRGVEGGSFGLLEGVLCGASLKRSVRGFPRGRSLMVMRSVMTGMSRI
ncbi:AAA family ATPase [Mycobacteroides abscessus]|uniref:Rad50/SbcC-type AAA domain-containing protein n=3 Tax=Mycolicibacterium TaxID=1866885 RepID=A0A064CI07_9MYCO|nr:hypothetical protein AB431_09175 [Mycobacterium sp. EPa45]APE15976.1 hypothetical protein BOH72_12875 [Mycobacterium sp. WY10]KDE98358.1 hypothetical protein Y900_005250 [Mycolicibacterium aromaticivorans JS19b1 = JCM 16368]MCA4748518.1 AAA family ATPase [Mycobacteroides abscessus]MCV7218327.1 AAA family ATPase [Mycolicibacterium crocinum]MCV7345499.1 AAA family ATPase [Mycolicibacterium rhodesiae]QYL18552.1 ATP-binding protein [Mycolicibacterium pallens]TGD84266.1 hypothetical protein Ba